MKPIACNCVLILLVLLPIAMSSNWNRVRVCMETVKNGTSNHSLSTHILDTSIGRAVPNITVSLYRLDLDNSWHQVNQSITDNDGRIKQLADPADFTSGFYKLHFDTEIYFKARNLTTFYPYIEIVVECAAGESYHVPLLLNAYGYSTYRGT